jgi:hypothetical protein
MLADSSSCSSGSYIGLLLLLPLLQAFTTAGDIRCELDYMWR